MSYLERVVNWTSQWSNWIAACFILAMMLLVCGNIVTRLFGQPIMGSYELVQFFMAFVISFALAYTTARGHHIAIDILVKRFSQRVQGVVHSFACLLSLGFFGVAVWRCIVYGVTLHSVGEVSITLWLPYFPILYLMAFSCALVCLILFIDLLKSLTRVVSK